MFPVNAKVKQRRCKKGGHKIDVLFLAVSNHSILADYALQ
jgi:hypothetical protein